MLDEEGLDPESFVSQLESDAVKPQDSVSQTAGSQASKARSSVAGPVVLKQLEEAATQASLEARVKRH